jgi:hypothetical protein
MVALPHSITFQDTLRDISRQKRSSMSKRIKTTFNDTFVGDGENIYAFRTIFSRDLERKFERTQNEDGSTTLTLDQTVFEDTISEAPDWTETGLYMTFLFRCHNMFESISML